ncbi:hypothetical protein GCM10009759_79540 [Kitasatospora saccharophila]|uniref:Uncharacterized protein n=2 Tax=Actinomycetes TaxID=1760 RepID=A0ABN2NN37_9MICO
MFRAFPAQGFALSGLQAVLAVMMRKTPNGAVWRLKWPSRRIDIHSKDFKHA